MAVAKAAAVAKAFAKAEAEAEVSAQITVPGKVPECTRRRAEMQAGGALCETLTSLGGEMTVPVERAGRLFARHLHLRAACTTLPNQSTALCLTCARAHLWPR